MIFTPRPYQPIATRFVLDNARCNLWVPMGMGKTASVLSALSILWTAGSKFHPALVLAPKRVAESVWPAEAARWDCFKDLKVSPVLGTDAQRRAALRAKADIYTMNYENLPWLVDLLGDRWPFQIVIADESSALKGFRLRHGGIRAAALSKVARKVYRWVNLTGTPAPNGLIDLWGQQWFVDMGSRLGRTYTAFKARWFTENAYDGSIKPHEHAFDEITGKLRDCSFSLDPHEWFDLREPIETRVPITLTGEARRVYDDMERDLYVELAGDMSIEAFSGATRSLKCLQIAAGFIYDEEGGAHHLHDEKILALRDVVAEASGSPVLVAYHFKPDLEKLIKAFPDGRPLLHAHDIDDWNAGKIPVMFAHPQSAGHGLNLQHGGHHIAFYSQGWSLEARQQIIERIGPLRQLQAGLDRPVFVTNIVASDTIEETVLLDRMVDKAETQAAVLGSVKR